MKRWIGVVVVAAAAMLATATAVSADVPRHQTQAGTLTVTLAAPYNYIHTYLINVNPCDNTFTGTGGSTFGGAAQPSVESIAGTLMPGTLAFTATYLPGGLLPGYTWSYAGPTAGGTAVDSTNLHFGITTALHLTASNWQNHGQYVKAMGGGSDAAHSCIGMPITSTP